jgi:hypothetical protein
MFALEKSWKGAPLKLLLVIKTSKFIECKWEKWHISLVMWASFASKLHFMMPNNLLSHIFEVEMATHINLPKFVLQKVSTLWAQSKGN